MEGASIRSILFSFVNYVAFSCITQIRRFYFTHLFAVISGFRIAMQNMGGICIENLHKNTSEEEPLYRLSFSNTEMSFDEFMRT